jgi:hypothetical protein
MSGITTIFPDLPGWSFDLDEVSAGVYLVKGVDEAGRSVVARGTDPESVLEQCRESAAKMQVKIAGRLAAPEPSPRR